MRVPSLLRILSEMIEMMERLFDPWGLPTASDILKDMVWF